MAHVLLFAFLFVPRIVSAEPTHVGNWEMNIGSVDGANITCTSLVRFEDSGEVSWVDILGGGGGESSTLILHIFGGTWRLTDDRTIAMRGVSGIAMGNLSMQDEYEYYTHLLELFAHTSYDIFSVVSSPDWNGFTLRSLNEFRDGEERRHDYSYRFEGGDLVLRNMTSGKVRRFSDPNEAEPLTLDSDGWLESLNEAEPLQFKDSFFGSGKRLSTDAIPTKSWGSVKGGF